MTSVSRNGLVWDESGLDITPVWNRELSLEAITNVCREKLQVAGSEICDVSFYAAGAFNKLYLVQTNQRQLLMRVSLPVHPQTKTRGEVTTLRFLRRETDTPVPEVIAFDDSCNNQIGFEWILMELMPGVSAYKKWRTFTTFQKVALVQRVAELQAQIFHHTFSGIGTLTVGDEDQNHQEEQPGEMVSKFYFWGNHFDYDVARGPFRSTYDWLASYLEIIIKDQITAKEEAEDEEDEEDASFALALAHRLADLLPKVFPSLQNPPERSVIWHDDMSLSNILVNEQGEITALLDWECVSALPLWMATEVPKFLQGSTREEEPKRQDYADESENESSMPGDNEDDDLDHEGKNELYWIHLMEYEKTQLRQLYNTQMCKSRPGWDAEIEKNALKEDFVGAVFRCGQGFFLKRIAQWIDAIDKGQFPRLKDVLETGLRL
ncbi:uncharacterized protein BHQ10_007263 [Talaromyces amestolkiae]|uniref:Aminoglycoside phosphotransferase domain-containing protein n=1 Tax=Talaromyces amestolkiae TaxID=1196081 RepID=A0A364L6B0_TALAM|nr:uncharacterized protein BHQ10_007263 [Talaromyces amestolkiae]RAO71251.1 hypothetical protein BHQ10_007263 [Talaromyces amestolkiae]